MLPSPPSHAYVPMHPTTHSPTHSPTHTQVDTWPKRGLLGVALTYIGLVVVLPFANVFIQVG